MEEDKRIDEETAAEAMDEDTPKQAPKKKKKGADFTDLVNTKIPEIEKLAETDLTEAINQFLALEKKTRQGGDIESTIPVAESLVTTCYKQNNFKSLNESLTYIAKRRGQDKKVIKAMVGAILKVIDSIEDMKVRIGVIDVLRTITEGKIYAEIERARLTKRLADIKEADGKVAEAAEILQEVQVETFGSMEPREKIMFILEQIRLCLAKNDYTRARIISRKIAHKALSGEDIQDLKLKYFHLMVEYYRNDNKYLDICRSYHYIYDTQCIKEEKDKWSRYLKLISFFVVLSAFDNEQSDMLHRIREDRLLIELPLYQALLKDFATDEVIFWPTFIKNYKGELGSLEVFDGEWNDQLWEDLKSRVIEHNIRVVAKYYGRISTKRLSTLLNLDAAGSEKYVSAMVSSKTIWAKIDRPAGIICFQNRKAPSETLNDWSHDVQELLGLLDKTCHLIQRETMVNKK